MYTGLGTDTPTFSDMRNPDGSPRLITVAELTYGMDRAHQLRYTDYSPQELVELFQVNPDLVFSAEEGLFHSQMSLQEAMNTPEFALWEEMNEPISETQPYVPPVAPGPPATTVPVVPSGGLPAAPPPPSGGVVSPTLPGGGVMPEGFPSWGILAIVGLGAYILGRK